MPASHAVDALFPQLARASQPSGSPASATLPILRQYFDALFHAHGQQQWWPARSPFEVIVGAILVQNTSWVNVERAIANLRQAKVLTPSAMLRISTPRLAALVRPSGYFRQKAKKLKAFV